MRAAGRNVLELGIMLTSAFVQLVLHSSLLTLFENHFHGLFTGQHYRPVYSRSGRRNHVRL